MLHLEHEDLSAIGTAQNMCTVVRGFDTRSAVSLMSCKEADWSPSIIFEVDPVDVLVIGGGVAELSAIGTAKNMGAVVRLFDTRFAILVLFPQQGMQTS